MTSTLGAVVRTQGLLFVRPEKSWHPVVCFDVVDRPQPCEVALGCDGQNTNTKLPIKLYVTPAVSPRACNIVNASLW